MALYVIQETEPVGRIKIGRARDPEQRLKDLQTGNSRRLRLLATLSAEDDLEFELHERFKAAHVRGEWFDLNPLTEPGQDILNYIARLGYIRWPSCPFCGARSARAVEPQEFGSYYHVQCYNCDASGPPGVTAGDAFESWIRRRAPKDSV